MIILERRKTITFEVIILDHVGDQPSLKQKKKNMNTWRKSLTYMKLCSSFNILPHFRKLYSCTCCSICDTNWSQIFTSPSVLIPRTCSVRAASLECSISVLFPSPKTSLIFLGEVKHTRNVLPAFVHLCSCSKIHFFMTTITSAR